jgi:hypothetical protein
MFIVSLKDLAHALQNNRFVIDDDGYPDLVEYFPEGEVRIDIWANQEDFVCSITDDAIFNENTNILSITDTDGVNYNVKFLSNEPINPF